MAVGVIPIIRRSIFPPPPNYGYVAGPGIYFGIGFGVVGALWGWDRWDWGHHDIHIDADRYNGINNYAISHDNRPRYTESSWRHDPAQRRGVPYGNPGLRQRIPPGFGRIGQFASWLPRLRQSRWCTRRQSAGRQPGRRQPGRSWRSRFSRRCINATCPSRCPCGRANGPCSPRNGAGDATTCADGHADCTHSHARRGATAGLSASGGSGLRQLRPRSGCSRPIATRSGQPPGPGRAAKGCGAAAKGSRSATKGGPAAATKRASRRRTKGGRQ